MKYFYLLLLCLFLGCSSNKKQQTILSNQEGTQIINLSENILEVSSLSLSEAAAKIEFVQLEATNDSYLGEIQKIHVTEHDIWVEQESSFYIYRFSRSGNFLNRIGKIGQGPEEYATCSDFFIDEIQEEVYIVSGEKGILVYDFDGNFKRMATKLRQSDIFMSSDMQYLLFNKNFFISQNMNFYNPTTTDSLWSFALVDSTFHKKKIFKNPIHIGKEELIIEHRALMDRMVNYWTENLTSIATYNNQLTLKYPDTDTIYQYDFCKEKLIPQYSIVTKEEKGDYESAHRWFKERKVFDYFSIVFYFPTKDFIYLIGNKGDKIYTYCYDKQNGGVRLQRRQGEITERKVPWFNIPYRRMECPFILNNDLCGGYFTVKHSSHGKYWIDILDLNSSDIEQIKVALVKDENQKKEFIKTLENIEEDNNPVLAIVTLK